MKNKHDITEVSLIQQWKDWRAKQKSVSSLGSDDEYYTKFVDSFKEELYTYLNAGIRGGLVDIASTKTPGATASDPSDSRAFDQMAQQLGGATAPGSQAFGQMAQQLGKATKVDPKAAAALKGRLKAGQGIGKKTGAGFTDYVKGSTTVQREGKYAALNSLFEQILEQISEDNQDSVSEFIMKFIAKEFTSEGLTAPSSVLSKFIPVTVEIQKAWQENNKQQVQASVDKLSNAWFALLQQASQEKGNVQYRTSTPVASPVKPNPQRTYTGSLTAQIEKMTADYKDDIPQIIGALLQKLKTINPNSDDANSPGYKQVVRSIANNNIEALLPQQKTQPTTESKQLKKK